MKRLVIAIILAAFTRNANSQQAPVSVTLTPTKDNTIYQESDNSNALGQGLFTGNTASANARRALMKFDLSSIPPGSTIQSASLAMAVTRTTVGATDVTIHRLTKNWGATTSQATGQEGGGGPPGLGDATWNTPAYQQGPYWTTPGGDFLPTTTVPASVSTGAVAFSGLAYDVRQFVNQPTLNFGWLLKGDEASQSSAKRYASRENAGAGPKLTITYAPPQTHRQTWTQLYFPSGQLIDDAADPDNDGISNLLEYAWANHPLQSSSMAEAFQITRFQNETIVKFLRDPRATDLDYKLETSTDLNFWDAVVTSAAGGGPMGVAFRADIIAPGKAPLKLVTASIPIQSQRTFTRLTVTRAP